MPQRILLSLALLLLALPAGAQEPVANYPSRLIRVISPYPPGVLDVMVRLVGDRLTAKWGQPVILENRPGAGGHIGTEAVFKAAPDGYTLLATVQSPLVISPSLYPKLGFDPARLVPVTIMASVPNLLMVHSRLPVSNVQDLVAYIRANPGKLNYAAASAGSSLHLSMELFNSQAGGLKMTHVPYNGIVPALNALLGGQVDISFGNLGVTLPHVRSGKIRALAMGSERRIAALPEVPAMAEFYPGFESSTWFGVLAPPRTPLPIAAKLSAAFAEALKQPEAAKRITGMPAELIANTPAEMTQTMMQETARWREVIRSANVKVGD